MLKLFVKMLLLSSLLGGCASMDKSECLVADWYTVGYEDGSLGKANTSISEYRKDCAKHHVVPNLDAYRNGHYEGSKQFCNERNGFAVGNSGRTYKRSCPQDLEDAFLLGYKDGQNLYSLNKVLRTYQKQIEHAVQRISRIDGLIAEKSELMIADGLIREQRAALREEIEELQEEQFHTELEIPELELALNTAQKQYDNALQHYNSKSH